MTTWSLTVDSSGSDLTERPVQLPSSERVTPPTWDEIGEGFETLGKVGLAMAVGFSAAGLFCRLAQQGKVKVPSISALLSTPPTEKRT